MAWGSKYRTTYRRRRRYGRKRRALAPSSIKKRTGAKAQSKQIMALTRQVRSLSRANYEYVNTVWQRASLPIEAAADPLYQYMCPIPGAMCDPNDTYSPGTGETTQWADNYGTVFFTKKYQFGYSASAVNSNHITHLGGTLKYQMVCTEPSMSKVTLALIRPKKLTADQLTADRQWVGGSPPVGPQINPSIIEGEDFVQNNGAGSVVPPTPTDTSFGTTFNRKNLDVLYQREITFGHPGATNTASNVNPSNTNPANNSLVASGTIRLPGIGLMKSVSQPALSQSGLQPSRNAAQLGILDTPNETRCYLVAISNGVTLDAATIYLGFNVVDRYKCVV